MTTTTTTTTNPTAVQESSSIGAIGSTTGTHRGLQSSSNAPFSQPKQQRQRRSIMDHKLLRVLLIVCVGVFSRSGTSSIIQPTDAAASSAAMKAAKNAFQSMDYRYFVAGGTCAAFSHGITTPIDVVKTKMQANPKVTNCKWL
jgi:hypothetical protein